MTSPTPEAAAAPGSVHRLVDMVVEEVSLVDRAANNHRFLLVKRDDAMANEPNANAGAEKATTDGAAPAISPSGRSAWDIAEGSPLGAALTALESLTAMVEHLCSLGTDPNDVRLAALAEQLRVAAEQILEGTGFARSGGDTEPEAPAAVQARAQPGKSPVPGEATAFASDLAAAKQALTRLTELVNPVAPAPAEKRDPAPAPAGAAAAPPALASPDQEALTKLAASFRTLSEGVQQLQLRLGRVEKQFGLPNSAPPAEQVAKRGPEEVGWPLDLNQPKDRENVDKTVSFHDL